MTAERLPLRKLRELMRMKFEAGMSGRAIARSCGMSAATVSDYLGRIKLADLSWPLPPELDEFALTKLLFPNEGAAVAQRPEPEWAWVHKELRRKHVTKQLLWLEYREQHLAGYGYSQFCQRYLAWAARLSVTMRQVHVAGEKCFMDFSGDGVDIVDGKSGECMLAKLFVAVLGASSLTYVEPVLSEDLPTWTQCHVHAFEYFEGATEIWVPDNLKSGVTRPDWYDPEVNPTYASLAEHYGAVVIPARVRKPRDKAKVEQGVLLAERWILAVLRNRTFYSLQELREAVKLLVEKLNNRPMQKLKKSRRQLFEELERAALKPLPSTPYEFSEWARPRVQMNYHVEFDQHAYSVDYKLFGQRLELRATATTIEIFRGGHRVASHRRSYQKHGYTTLTEHMPPNHREYAEWNPPRLLAWAKTVGPMTAKLIDDMMSSRKHPEQGFKACRGILGLRKNYADERIEAACARAVQRRACTYRSVVAILKNNLDKETASVEENQCALPHHENVRGPGYYH